MGVDLDSVLRHVQASVCRQRRFRLHPTSDQNEIAFHRRAVGEADQPVPLNLGNLDTKTENHSFVLQPVAKSFARPAAQAIDLRKLFHGHQRHVDTALGAKEAAASHPMNPEPMTTDQRDEAAAWRSVRASRRDRR